MQKKASVKDEFGDGIVEGTTEEAGSPDDHEDDSDYVERSSKSDLYSRTNNDEDNFDEDADGEISYHTSDEKKKDK
jgi:hypothetical protein